MADEAATWGGIYKPLFLIKPRITRITTVFTIRESHNKDDDVLISLNTRHNCAMLSERDWTRAGLTLAREE